MLCPSHHETYRNDLHNFNKSAATLKTDPHLIGSDDSIIRTKTHSVRRLLSRYDTDCCIILKLETFGVLVHIYSIQCSCHGLIPKGYAHHHNQLLHLKNCFNLWWVTNIIIIYYYYFVCLKSAFDRHQQHKYWRVRVCENTRWSPMVDLNYYNAMIGLLLVAFYCWQGISHKYMHEKTS